MNLGRNVNITQIINELESLLNSTVPAKGKPFPKIRGPSKQDKVLYPANPTFETRDR